jgi:hypothetical protein
MHFPITNDVPFFHLYSAHDDAREDTRLGAFSHPFCTRQDKSAPHSAQEPSYTEVGDRPISCSAKANMQAEIPDPQVVITVST